MKEKEPVAVKEEEEVKVDREDLRWSVERLLVPYMSSPIIMNVPFPLTFLHPSARTLLVMTCLVAAIAVAPNVVPRTVCYSYPELTSAAPSLVYRLFSGDWIRRLHLLPLSFLPPA